MKFIIYFQLLLFILTFNPGIAAQDTIPVNSLNMKADDYSEFTHDGAWCWFSDPRAIYHEGNHQRTYAGWINSEGDVVVAYYDHKTKEIVQKTLEKNFQIDDHDNPALLFRPDGRLMVFFTKHSGPCPTYVFTMKKPEDISSWEKQELHLNDDRYYPNYKVSNTYVNPVLLTEEDNRIYLFWRGMDRKPSYSFSDDLGKTWSPGRIFIMPDSLYALRRPYLKVASNGKNKIFFAFTDGHPRKEKTNSIYYMYYKSGFLFNSEDKKIGKLGDDPVHPDMATCVYDASVSGEKAWIWDIAANENDNPVLVYARFPDDRNHIYYYAKWNGEKWLNLKMINSGGWFPQTPPGQIEREPNYSGGICLDHENPETAYLSVKRNGIFEIEKWQLKRNSQWTKESITSGSEHDNIRPFAIRNANEDNDLQLLWLYLLRYLHYTDYHAVVKTNLND